MRKINLKMMIIALIVVFLAINLNSKYSQHKELLENKKLLLENKKNFEKKIIEIETEKSLEKEKNMADYDKIMMLTRRLSFFSIKNESEFKKMIYIFAHESDLKVKEISKSEEFKGLKNIPVLLDNRDSIIEINKGKLKLLSGKVENLEKLENILNQDKKTKNRQKNKKTNKGLF